LPSLRIKPMQYQAVMCLYLPIITLVGITLLLRYLCFFLFLFTPALVYIMLILAHSAAKFRIIMSRDKRHITIPTKSKRPFFVHQRKPKHRLHRQQQGMKIPQDSWLVVVHPYTVGWRFATESRYALLVQLSGELVNVVFQFIK